MNKKIIISAAVAVVLVSIVLFVSLGGFRLFRGPRAGFPGPGMFNADGNFNRFAPALGLPEGASPEQIREALGLPADATNEQVMQALSDKGLFARRIQG